MNVKKTVCAIIGTAWLGLSVAAVAHDSMMRDHDMMMKSMDSNGDGMISKDEYMGYYQKKWDGMQKNSSDMVDAKSMMMPHDRIMKDKSMTDDKVNQ